MMATQIVKYFMLAQNRCQSLESWKGPKKSKCLETLRAFDFFGELKNREEILIDS